MLNRVVHTVTTMLRVCHVPRATKEKVQGRMRRADIRNAGREGGRMQITTSRGFMTRTKPVGVAGVLSEF